MELLMRAAAATPDGASVARAPVARPRTLSLAVGVSIGVHAALFVAAVAAPARALLDDAPVTVEIVEVVPPPAIAPAEPPPPKPEVARPVVLKRVRPVEAPLPAPAAPPPPQELPAAEPSPPVASAPTTETTQDPHAVLVATAPPGAGISGGGPGVAGGRAPAGVTSEGQRRALADRYLTELVRTRIRDHFHYPEAASELELTGRVVVQVTIDRNGRLLAARLAGRCPHPLLCEDGLRTVRASAPFPALPADLGDSLRLEIPLNYDLK
jgi:periplasmic protein TonB